MSEELTPTQNSLQTNTWADTETFLAGKLSDKTKDAYARDLIDFFENFLHLNNYMEITPQILRRITPQKVIDWRDYMLKELNWENATVARKMSTLRNFLDCFVDEGILQRNPARHTLVKAPKVPNVSGTIGLSEAEAKKVLKIAKEKRASTTGAKQIVAYRNYAIMHLLLNNGPRRAEVVNIKIRDLGKRDDYDVITIIGKGDKPRILKIKPTTKEAIEDYLRVSKRKESDPEEYLFISHNEQGYKRKIGKPMSTNTILSLVKSLIKKAKIKKRISPHSMRKTFITLALKNGASLRKTQDSVGHSRPETTARYDEERLHLEDNASDYVDLED